MLLAHQFNTWFQNSLTGSHSIKKCSMVSMCLLQFSHMLLSLIFQFFRLLPQAIILCVILNCRLVILVSRVSCWLSVYIVAFYSSIVRSSSVFSFHFLSLVGLLVTSSKRWKYVSFVLISCTVCTDVGVEFSQ